MREDSRQSHPLPRPWGRDDLCRPGESFGILVGLVRLGQLFGLRGARIRVAVDCRGVVVFSRASCVAMLECWNLFAALVVQKMAGLARKDLMCATIRNCRNQLFDSVVLGVVAAAEGDADSHNLEMKLERGCNRCMHS